jgi:hypothetical protein
MDPPASTAARSTMFCNSCFPANRSSPNYVDF